MNGKTDTLIAEMNEIYSYIYKEKWPHKMPSRWVLTRNQPHMNYRHIVRYMMHRERGCTYKIIASLEAEIFKVDPPDHTTILNSINICRDYLAGQDEYKPLFHQIGFLFDLKRGYQDRGINYAESIRTMMQLPQHVLAITLAGVCHHKLIHHDLVQTLINEYSNLDEEFVTTFLLTNPEE